MIEILTISWLLVIIACILEAYFCTKFDTESLEFFKKREYESKTKNREIIN